MSREDELRQCKRCLLAASGREDTLKLVEQYKAKIPEKDKCPADIYSKRLEVCSSCDFLVDGTCLKCGCYVELRASYKSNKCSINKWRKI